MISTSTHILISFASFEFVCLSGENKKKKKKKKPKKKKVEQSDPPRFGLSKFYPDGVYPEGEIQPYKNECVAGTSLHIWI